MGVRYMDPEIRKVSFRAGILALQCSARCVNVSKFEPVNINCLRFLRSTCNSRLPVSPKGKFIDLLTRLRIRVFCRRYAKAITSTNEQRHDVRLLGNFPALSSPRVNKGWMDSPALPQAVLLFTELTCSDAKTS